MQNAINHSNDQILLLIIILIQLINILRISNELYNEEMDNKNVSETNKAQFHDKIFKFFFMNKIKSIQYIIFWFEKVILCYLLLVFTFILKVQDFAVSLQRYMN